MLWTLQVNGYLHILSSDYWFYCGNAFNNRQFNSTVCDQLQCDLGGCLVFRMIFSTNSSIHHNIYITFLYTNNIVLSVACVEARKSLSCLTWDVLIFSCIGKKTVFALILHSHGHTLNHWPLLTSMLTLGSEQDQHNGTKIFGKCFKSTTPQLPSPGLALDKKRLQQKG